MVQSSSLNHFLVFDVLENQARSALLPDAIISTILSQPQVKVTYEPLNCENLFLTLADQAQREYSILNKRLKVTWKYQYALKSREE
ncbi:hypothetical protein KIN20_014161 [Parelaphostrongylus tenuis]|uniref:Uncharacterized protein n=1 Tax=Parelaphostrongylus tenuis TaxID=148309 RepID=A0AAD5QP33_PARTN|nr:hypothetical protein KIN20_014161 [Parelaphostrongylus tenuis]